jgi:hypothetical protein
MERYHGAYMIRAYLHRKMAEPRTCCSAGSTVALPSGLVARDLQPAAAPLLVSTAPAWDSREAVSVCESGAVESQHHHDSRAGV